MSHGPGRRGTATETLILVVPSLAGITWFERGGHGHFAGAGSSTAALMLTTGVVSAAPLWWFAMAAGRLSLTSMGFLQYLAPSLQLLLVVFLFVEAFTSAHAITFGCLWAGIALVAPDVWRTRGR